MASGLAIHFWGYDRPLDTKFYYTGNEAVKFFDGLTAEEGKVYLRHECLDFLFIFSYSALFFRVLRRLYADNLVVSWLGLVPGLFDLTETGTIALILMRAIPIAPSWLGFMTCSKWITGATVVFVIGFQILKRTISVLIRD